jgi:superfamily II DNA or RNA helicase
VPSADGNPFESLGFGGAWRHYQRLALNAFELDRSRGRRHTHVVAPPGSGKTLMGIEMVRRLGRRAAVLAPNSAIQQVWFHGVARFSSDGAAAEGLTGATPEAPLAILTYQSLCRLDDPGNALDGLAEARWLAERAKATGETPEAVRAEAAGWTGAAADRRRRELARVRAALKREVARGDHPLDLADLLSEEALGRLRRLRELGVGTLVLDECHHLASMWGYVVRAAAAELGSVHLIGLTATPPEELTTDEAELYAELLGPVDFTVPTPAVVKDGYLAPYQELAWFTEPLASEVSWLREHDQRFRDLVAELHDESEQEFLSFPGWVITRMRYREAAGDAASAPAGDPALGGGAELSWERFAKRRPALARAGVRFLASGGLELPKGAPRGEGYRRPPDLEDWLVLLEDYALRCLRAESSDEAARRYDAVAAALRDLGFQLTRQGIRRGASDVDRLLTASGAKPIALAEVMACEYDVRGDALRALVLADAEVASVRADAELATALDPAAGTAPRAVLALASDMRTAPLRPLLVSGRGLRCAPHDAEHLVQGLSRATPTALDVSAWAASGDERDGLVQVEARGRDWNPRSWVAIATAAFASGATRALVGTRGMLGEGWDAPSVNCLVDLTATTTGVSVRQMRGRSLRLDPNVAGKVASNWDVVCVAPDLARGAADYERFVRKHLHLHAPTEEGAIEAGPSHVHPELGPFAPPPAADFAEINAQMRQRAAAIDEARARWRIGEPYAGEELRTIVAKARRPARAPGGTPERPPGVPVDQRLQGGLAAAAIAVGAAGGVALAPLIAPVGVIAALGAGAWARARLRRARALLTDAAPLDLAASALRDAYESRGELSPDAARSLTIEPRASGYLRCSLERATPEESARFATGLDELLGPVAAPRYLVSRLVVDDRGDLALTARAMTGRRIATTRWHAVPADLGRLKPRAEALATAWREWLGPSRLVFTQRSDAGRRTLAEAVAQADAFELMLRDVWH